MTNTRKTYIILSVCIFLCLILTGCVICSYFNSKDFSEDTFELNKESNTLEKISQERFFIIQQKFSPSGDHRLLTNYVNNLIGSSIIIEHINTQWLDQINGIAVKSSYQIRDVKGREKVLTIYATITDENKISVKTKEVL